MKRHSSYIACILFLTAFVQHLAPFARAADGERRELWTGSMYSSTYRAGVCIRSNGDIYGALYLRQSNGAVDRYTLSGKVEGDRITARHTSGHEFEGHFASGDTVEGELTLKNGHKLKVQALRGPEPEVDELCRLVRQQ
jgi:hypothetical protein